MLGPPKVSAESGSNSLANGGTARVTPSPTHTHLIPVLQLRKYAWRGQRCEEPLKHQTRAAVGFRESDLGEGLEQSLRATRRRVSGSELPETSEIQLQI